MREKIIGLLSDATETNMDLIQYFSTNDEIDKIGLDSLGFIKLIVMLEEEFNILFDEDDLLFDNFKTLGFIEEYIKQRKSNLE